MPLGARFVSLGGYPPVPLGARFVSLGGYPPVPLGARHDGFYIMTGRMVRGSAS